jgi:mono/diheme cytochrome c family protein
MTRHRIVSATVKSLVAALGLVFCQSVTNAANEEPQPFTNPGRFIYQDGEHLYRAICQGCHMADGKGAQGAGMYPALAENPRLAAGAYAALVVRQGKNGMPPVGNYLDDAQIAAVVNYVRTHFGNSYKDALTVDDVKKLGKNP